MNPSLTIAIIGGGVAGLGPAWQLAKQGHDVHLFERHQVGSGASGRAAGMLAPTSEVTFEEEDLLRLGQRSQKLYPDWLTDLQDLSDIDLDHRQSGTLIVAIDRDDAEALEHLYRYHRRLELPVERLVGDEARQREPGLSPRVHYALDIPRDRPLDPAAMVRAMAQAFRARGGHLHEGQSVEGLLMGDDGVQGLRLADGEVHRAPIVLVAAGAWSPQLQGLPDDALPHLRPIRGQMIVVDQGDPPLVQRIIRAPDAYLVPRSDGRLLIGSTMEERGFDDRLTAGGLRDILDGAWEAVPGIYDAPVLDSWVGFRPMTLANRPVIGPSTVDGLYLSVGHGRNGILLTPITAYGLTECITTGEIPDYLRPFQLN